MENTLPKNWVETEFKELTSFVIGGDWGKDLEFEYDVESELVSCIRGSEIKNWKRDKGSTSSIRKVKSSSLEKRALIEGDILIEISGGGPDQPVGRTIFIDEEALMVNSEYKKVCTNFLRMVRLYDNLNKKFIKNYLDSFYLSGEVLKYQGGSNNLRNLKFKEFEIIKIPLPPLAEQQRIVAKLDVLFNHLETLKTRLEQIPQLLKNFRQAVLTQAVTGKLTEEWRVGKELEDVKNIVKEFLEDLAKNEKSLPKKKKIKALIKEKSFKEFKIPPEWEFFKLDKLCLAFTYGSSSKSLNEGLVPVLRMGNLQKGKLDWTKLKYSIDESEIKKYLLVKGDVLFNRTNSPELVGKTSLYLGEQKAIYAGYLIKIVTGEVLNSSYLNYALNSPYAKEWCWKVKTDGVSQSNINAQKLSQFNIPYPSFEEQTEIVKRVEALFAKADKIEAQYQSLKIKIDSLPQAILAKAFKGELVAQLPTDGSAKELLEEIKKLKASLQGKKKPVKRKKK